ncbi:MAG: hypothetical protein U1C46_05620 [Bacteroidales bacterium]|nr:hypothetical protein [Bacteroidales bacterium]
MKSVLKILFINLLIFSGGNSIAQGTFNPDGYNTFYHLNGIISSEGMMRSGKPDGFWKTYYETGVLKSEGNRKEFELDSIWKFYNEVGGIILKINYLSGKKHGERSTYREEEIIKEMFVLDQKEGVTYYLYPDGLLRRTIPFINGLEHGNGFEYDRQGNIITLTEYRRGFIINRESINRNDHNGLRQGRWKFFYSEGTLQMEGTYREGRKDGYFKTYDQKGNLLDLKKYVEDIEIQDVPEIAKLTARNEYYETGKIKNTTTYRNNLPEGIRREYDEEGKIEIAIVYASGKMLGEGIVNEEGVKEGPWKEYYFSSQLRAQGVYLNGKKKGEWIFHYENEQVEQKGNYDDTGRPIGKWSWYHDNGKLWREELYINGLKDGLVTEFGPLGNVIAEGEYFEGMEDGKWIYNSENHRIEGNYRAGMRNGAWKHYYKTGQLSFEGDFIEDNANGKHTYYWENGLKKDEEYYVNGRKEGDWTRYNDDGTPLLVITYSNNREIRYDGVKITPEFDEE